MLKTINEMFRFLSSQLNSSLEARIILSEALGLKQEDLLIKQNSMITNNQFLLIQEMLLRRLKSEPIAYITGYKEFYSLKFNVNQHTLIPRPDSECLVDFVIKNFKESNPKILDLGTGSGCLVITILKNIPNASALAIDVCFDALSIAKKNAVENMVDNRLNLACSDWNKFDFLNEKFDLIISNPPYIPTKDIKNLENNVKSYEPIKALDGGDDGLACYREIFLLASRLINTGGSLIVEIGINQHDDVKKIASDHHFISQETIYDLAGIKRAICFTKN